MQNMYLFSKTLSMKLLVQCVRLPSCTLHPIQNKNFSFLSFYSMAIHDNSLCELFCNGRSLYKKFKTCSRSNLVAFSSSVFGNKFWSFYFKMQLEYNCILAIGMAQSFCDCKTSSEGLLEYALTVRYFTLLKFFSIHLFFNLIPILFISSSPIDPFIFSGSLFLAEDFTDFEVYNNALFEPETFRILKFRRP